MTSVLVSEFKNEFQALINNPQKLCVSIYMPVSVDQTKLRQNCTRFKNLLRQAEELLSANRRSPTVALKILQPALALLTNESLWARQQQGLAILLADGFFHHYSIPFLVQELVVVADDFYLKPLIPLLTSI